MLFSKLQSLRDRARQNKKGVFGLNAVQAFLSGILAIIILAYVVVYILGNLQTNGTLTAGSLTYNYTQQILGNGSLGIISLVSSLNPVYAIIGLLVLILVFAVIIRAVGGNGGFGGAGGQGI